MSLLDQLPEGAIVTVDTAPIIFVLENHATLAPRYAPLFEAAEAGRNHIVVSAVTVAEVLTGPLRANDELLATRYKLAMLQSPGWSVQDVTADVAEHAARIRATHRLRLPDAIQVATTIVSGSYALLTHDRDFSSITHLRVLMSEG